MPEFARYTFASDLSQHQQQSLHGNLELVLPACGLPSVLGSSKLYVYVKVKPRGVHTYQAVQISADQLSSLFIPSPHHEWLHPVYYPHPDPKCLMEYS